MNRYLLLILLTTLCGTYTFAQTGPNCREAEAKNTRYENQLKDWAQLGRYRDANAALRSQQKRDVQAVFLGDSITEGWNLDQYFPGKSYVNRGISGQTTTQMLIRFRTDVIDLKPRVVVILAGTNDIAGNTGPMTLEDTSANIESIVELAKANNIKVILSSILPVNDRTKNTDGTVFVQTEKRPNAKITAMNNWLKRYAAENDLIYLDYYSEAVTENGTLKDGLSYDGLHPDGAGYKLMAQLADRAVSSALRR